MEITIERLRARDWQRGMENTALFWDKNPPTEQKLKEFLAKEYNVLIVAEIDGKPAGQIIGYVLERWDNYPPMFFFYSIDVAESAQRMGIGRRLVEKFREVGRELGCGISFVFTNESNIGAMEFYKSTGAVRPNPDDVMYEYLDGERY
ncbi:MAG TPA: GNAT family N-acetyltransferase [Candidatus Kapabacteria bacterium]|nr:GNAT family N-acetyltransferase [Candidatus Kapabacteria bacterium]